MNGIPVPEPIVFADGASMAEAAEVAHVVGAGLNTFNDAVTSTPDCLPLAIVVHDPATSEVTGGVTGRSSLGLRFIDLFYLPKHLRGGGLGSRILCMAEEEGGRRRCGVAVLMAISVQAPGFYERHGWRHFGEIAYHPPGTSRVFMTQTL